MRVTDPEGAEPAALRSIVEFTDKDVVEIGCGSGRLTWRYADDAASVLAIDPKEADIAAAQTNTGQHLASRVTFRVGDITTDPLPEAAFDLAILSYSL